MDAHELTPRKALQNPSGNGTGYTYARYLIKQSLTDIYAQLAKIKRGNAFIYKNWAYIHLMIPSTKYEIDYDVVIKIEISDESTVMDSPLQLFSNSPAFQYTYTYALNQKGWLPAEFKNKCFERALKEAPVVRNPIEQWGFEKSTFFALMYLQQEKFLTGKNLYNALKEFKPNIEKLKTDIKHSTYILSRYKKLKYQDDLIKKQLR